jgi:uncharacterized membrane protein YhaH (DUF805 family)
MPERRSKVQTVRLVLALVAAVALAARGFLDRNAGGWALVLVAVVVLVAVGLRHFVYRD